MDPTLPILGLASVSAGAVVASEQLEQRRCRALEREARALGLSFVRLAEPDDIAEGLVVRPHDSTCIATQLENVMQGTIGGRRVVVFNLRAYSAFGEGSSAMTFAAFQCSEGQRVSRQSQSSFEVESSGRWLLICRPGHVVGATTLRDFVERSFEIASRLLEPDLPVALRG